MKMNFSFQKNTFVIDDDLVWIVEDGTLAAALAVLYLVVDGEVWPPDHVPGH